MKRKLFAFVFCLLVCAALPTALFACGKGDLPDDLVLTGENVTDVPAGEYTLPYTVENYEKYKNEYELSLSVTVYDGSNEPVTVENNRKIVVQADKTYTVLVMLYSAKDGKRVVRSHEFFVRAEHSARTVTFVYDEDDLEIETLTVPYGSSIAWDDLPELPDRYFVGGDDEIVGFTEITYKRWIVYSGSTSRELTPEDLQNITRSFTVYGYLEYVTHALPVVVHFESNGGTEIPDYHTDTQTPLDRQPSPEKDGFAFVGWYFDEECTSPYNWNERTFIPADFTLYAKYVEANDDECADLSLFRFTPHENEFGNAYYSLAPKNPAILTGDLVLPTAYNRLPVSDVDENAFDSSPITSVLIPSSYRLSGQYQFHNCASLVSVIFEEGSRTYDIPQYCFADCVALRDLTLPGNLIRIRSHAFYGCLSLSDLVLPETLNVIGDNAFGECKSLTRVSAPDALSDITDYAFAGCERLSELLFGRNASISYIADTALDDTAVTGIVLPSRCRTSTVFDGDVDRVHITYYPDVE